MRTADVRIRLGNEREQHRLRTQRVRLFVTILTAFLLAPRIAIACGCKPFAQTALEVYEGADLVVIARMLSVEKASPPKRPYRGDISSATMVVEKVYKGDVTTNPQLKLDQGDEVLGCSWSFYAEEVGDRFLLYLNPENKPTKEMPFPRLYYPGVTEREKATTISIKHGQSLNNLNIIISERSPVQK